MSFKFILLYPVCPLQHTSKNSMTLECVTQFSVSEGNLSIDLCAT